MTHAYFIFGPYHDQSMWLADAPTHFRAFVGPGPKIEFVPPAAPYTPIPIETFDYRLHSVRKSDGMHFYYPHDYAFATLSAHAAANILKAVYGPDDKPEC